MRTLDANRIRKMSANKRPGLMEARVCAVNHENIFIAKICDSESAKSVF